MRYFIAGLTVFFLAACQPEVETVGQVSGHDGKEKSACEDLGGRYLSHHPHVSYECEIPFPDAGKACSRATDCSAQCLAETRTCSAWDLMYGKWQELDDDGNVVTVEGY
jgi:hypothetical protein